MVRSPTSRNPTRIRSSAVRASALAQAFLILGVSTAIAQGKDCDRARDLGIPFDGIPGPLNAITDVDGVEVGHRTIICGEGELMVGEGPIRTGVTAILPVGKSSYDAVAAGWSYFNCAGELTGTKIIDEFGLLSGPVLLTNTLSVGAVQSAVVEWNRLHVDDPDVLYSCSVPVVGETWDGFLNDIYGQHVDSDDVFCAINGAQSGWVREGDVGGGTGMRTFDFKGASGPRLASSAPVRASAHSESWCNRTSARGNRCSSPAFRWARK